ncbi:unnamed protein product [Lepeophtheirus salmonis]|uniref:(salmon louse) hypothetical protein n=1 Tax=Lepeophtheirus salmonis TaxID=72036 RepID=A0A7R8D4E6_LEPSM|nr:unnamed protein product [Lepeophtheirus salmonis]CAF2994903.1 unnamed protein product [Lepeophtheirus salmonis]
MSEELRRRTCIPILYTRGTHYEVGYDIGHTFRNLIESSLSNNVHLNTILVHKYESEKVRHAYEDILEYLEHDYPQFIDELKGSGPEVLLALRAFAVTKKNKVILGHSIDYFPDAINHTYMVSAHIMEAKARGKWGCAEEKFTAMCLPGMLPGFYMSYNHHGFVYTVNTISSDDPPAKKVFSLRTPRHFLCRALLTCRSMFDATEILQDEGHGISDGLSVNMIFCRQEGSPLFHNAEVAPPPSTKVGNEANESIMSVLTLSSGEYLTHCNKFLRLSAPQSDQLPLWSSNHRHEVLKTLPRVESVSNVVAILGRPNGCDVFVFSVMEVEEMMHGLLLWGL